MVFLYMCINDLFAYVYTILLTVYNGSTLFSYGLFVLYYNLFEFQVGNAAVINGPNNQSSLNVCLFFFHHLFTNSFMTGTHFLLFKRKALEKSAVLLLACE